MSHRILAHHLLLHQSVEPLLLRILAKLSYGNALVPGVSLPEELVGILFDGYAGFEVG